MIERENYFGHRIGRLSAMAMGLLICLSLAACRTPGPTPDADGAFILPAKGRIAFFGDSITQSGQYVRYVEAFLATRFPDRDYEVINRGISSETISGTSEPDHDPRRPDAHERFARDITPLKPDIVIACFGMNDGNYRPPNAQLQAKYLAGVRRLIQRVREESGGRLIFMTPPPFDPYRRSASDANAVHYGYKFASLEYDKTLENFSKALLELRREGFTVADLHASGNHLLAERRKSQVSFYLAGDAVHPNATGHWAMAHALLAELGAPAEAGSVEVDGATGRAAGGQVSDLISDAAGVRFNWTTGLPMPIDDRWDAQSLQILRTTELLNRHRIAIKGLGQGTWKLMMNDQEVAKVSAAELQAGLDLTRLPACPTNQQARQVQKLIDQRQEMLYTHWRESVRAGGKPNAATPQKAAQLQEEIRRLTRPIQVKVDLLRAD